MTKDREIVLMLIKRERFAKQLYAGAVKSKRNETYIILLETQWASAHNSCELARRILRGDSYD